MMESIGSLFNVGIGFAETGLNDGLLLTIVVAILLSSLIQHAVKKTILLFNYLIFIRPQQIRDQKEKKRFLAEKTTR